MKVGFVVLGLATALLVLSLFVVSETARAADPTPADLVDALNGVFGKPQGTRSAHTKGFCLAGQFTPAPDAAKLSKAAHFAKPVPITARLSLGGAIRMRQTAPRPMSGDWRSASTSAGAPSPIL